MSLKFCKMTGNETPVVFVTANVGSIFEEPSTMLHIWAAEFLSTISRLDPKFVALHCQEVGGKNYEKSMQYVKDFVQLLTESEELRLFDRVRIFLDEDFSSADKFTALGNFYFIHESVAKALIYDFQSHSFEQIEGHEVYGGDIENVTTMEKSKFPLEYFPECKWSRKGFLRTRWNINGSIFDLVNIHLFHDASNFVAIESFPSEYSETRRQALIYTLDRFQKDDHETVPFFLFGDFNFRTDTKSVVNRLSEGLNRNSPDGDDDDGTIEYCDDDDGKVLCLGKKTFSHFNHQDVFCGDDCDWLREFDRELEFFSDQLHEFGVKFQPTYPFEEGTADGKLYMKTRCPAWCDRVLLSKDAVSLVKDFSCPGRIEYSLIGSSTSMGDHKPVYLRIEVITNPAKESPVEGDAVGNLEKVDDSDLDNIDLEKVESSALERSGLVKRVNSASLVENNKAKREDWKSARCNSDVSWNPSSHDVVRMNKLRNPLLKGSSKIRLISTSTSLNHSLPRLTSHHSSSDEDWFEVVDGDDDVLEMKKGEVENIQEEPVTNNDSTIAQLLESESEPNKALPLLPFSIFKRLTKERKDSKITDSRADLRELEKHEERALASSLDVPEPKGKTHNYFLLKTQSLFRSMKRDNNLPQKGDEMTKSWETIELNDSKVKAEGEPRNTAREGCCVIQ